MSTPFLAEIKIFAGNFAPRGFASCDGQILPIQQNAALFSLLGTQYGGNGQTNFALPNLQGSIPMGSGTGPGLTPRSVGESGGTTTVTLGNPEVPSHQHALQAFTGRGGTNAKVPTTGATLTSAQGGTAYVAAAAPVAMSTNTILPAENGPGPHNNLMPNLPLFFIIALEGEFPARN